MDENLEKIRKVLMDNRGVDISSYRENYLWRRISSRMRRLRLDNIGEYIEVLRKDENEQIKLIDAIGINVTSFFRDFEVFDSIKKNVFPFLKEQEEIYIWSAGCATGEEPFSIVILFLEEGFSRFRVIATDFDSESLELAEKGIFEIDRFKETPKELIEKYFIKLDEKKYMVKNFLKEYVIFKYHNLFDEPPLLFFDLVLCRNVIIYFSKEYQEAIFYNLYKSLKPGGFLVLGKTEFIPLYLKNKFSFFDKLNRIYRKI